MSSNRLLVDLPVEVLANVISFIPLATAGDIARSAKTVRDGFKHPRSFSQRMSLTIGSDIVPPYREDLCAVCCDALKQMPQLASLNLSNAALLSDADLIVLIDHIKDPFRIRHLTIHGCNELTDQSIRRCAEKFTRLLSLDLSDNLSLRTPLSFISLQCRFLEKVILDGLSYIDDEQLSDLAENQGPRLLHLSLAQCGRVTNTGIMLIAEHCPELRYLNVRDVVQLTDVSGVGIATGCQKLETLILAECGLISTATLLSIGDNLKELKHLDIIGLSRITDLGVIHIAQQLKKLSFLDVGKAHGLTSKSLEAVVRNLPHLKGIGIGETSCTPEAVQELILSSITPNLTYLDLSWIRSIHAPVLKHLAYFGQNLISLNLKKNKNVDRDFLCTLGEHCHAIEHLTLRGIDNIDDFTLVSMTKTEGTLYDKALVSWETYLANLGGYHKGKFIRRQGIKEEEFVSNFHFSSSESGRKCFPNLKTLDIVQCSQVTCIGVLCLGMNFGKSLEKLEINWKKIEKSENGNAYLQRQALALALSYFCPQMGKNLVYFRRHDLGLPIHRDNIPMFV